MWLLSWLTWLIQSPVRAYNFGATWFQTEKKSNSKSSATSSSSGLSKTPETPSAPTSIQLKPARSSLDFSTILIPSNLKRITPAEVVAAYKKTGLIPISCSFWWKVGDKMAGCGLTALACDKLGKKEDEFYMRGLLVAESMEKQLGYDWAYLQGFTCGFDSKPLSMLESLVTAIGAGSETRKLRIEDKENVMGKAYAGFLDGTESSKAVGSPKAPYTYTRI